MSKMSFLHERSEKENTRINNVVRKAVVDGSVQIGLIRDNNLAMIPESIGVLSQLAHTLREDLCIFRRHVNTQSGHMFTVNPVTC